MSMSHPALIEALQAQPLCAREIAALCGVSNPVIHKWLRYRMVAGLVREEPPSDKERHARAKKAYALTDAGRAYIAEHGSLDLERGGASIAWRANHAPRAEAAAEARAEAEAERERQTAERFVPHGMTPSLYGAGPVDVDTLPAADRRVLDALRSRYLAACVRGCYDDPVLSDDGLRDLCIGHGVPEDAVIAGAIHLAGAGLVRIVMRDARRYWIAVESPDWLDSSARAIATGHRNALTDARAELAQARARIAELEGRINHRGAEAQSSARCDPQRVALLEQETRQQRAAIQRLTAERDAARERAGQAESIAHQVGEVEAHAARLQDEVDQAVMISRSIRQVLGLRDDLSHLAVLCAAEKALVGTTELTALLCGYDACDYDGPVGLEYRERPIRHAMRHLRDLRTAWMQALAERDAATEERDRAVAELRTAQQDLADAHALAGDHWITRLATAAADGYRESLRDIEPVDDPVNLLCDWLTSYVELSDTVFCAMHAAEQAD